MLFNKTEREKIKKLHDNVVKDSDALSKLAYEFGQMANYFDRANSAHSREELGREDEVKYKEFLRKGIQVKAQLQREIEGMKKGMKAGQEIGYFNSYDNKTLGLLSDAISRLSWTSHDMRDNTGEKVAKELDNLYDEYKKLLTNGKRYDSKPKDSRKVKDAAPDYPDTSAFGPSVIDNYLDTAKTHIGSGDLYPEDKARYYRLAKQAIDRARTNIADYSKECADFERFAKDYRKYIIEKEKELKQLEAMLQGR